MVSCRRVLRREAEGVGGLDTDFSEPDASWASILHERRPEFFDSASQVLVKGLPCARRCRRCWGCDSERQDMALAFTGPSAWSLHAACGAGGCAGGRGHRSEVRRGLRVGESGTLQGQAMPSAWGGLVSRQVFSAG